MRYRPLATIFTAAVAAVAALGCSKPEGYVAAPSGATAEPLGVVPQSARIQGRDGGQSGLAFGHSVWTFGDTVLNAADAEGVSWHQNSWSHTDDRSASDGVSGLTEPTDSAGAPTYFIAPTADEATYNAAHYGDPCSEQPCNARWAAWPGAPIWDAAHGQAFAFYGLIHAAPGDYNFYGVGQGLAVWRDFAALPERPEVSPGAEHPTLLFGQDEPAWGTAALVEGDTLYAFACDGGLSPSCSLARVPTAKAIQRDAWQFYDGSAWTTEMGDRKTLFSGAATVTVGFNAYLGLYTAVYAEPLSTRVVIRVAKAVTGPWSDTETLFEADKPEGNAYDAVTHAEFEEERGKVLYVTFSRGNGVGWFGSEFQLVRVRLP